MRRIMLSAVVTLFLVQCATVTQGPMQRIRVGSRPPGATVELSECGVGANNSAVTPATVFVNRRAALQALTECRMRRGLGDQGRMALLSFK